MSNAFPFTPGFSPVIAGNEGSNRFNGFSHSGKPLKRLVRSIAPNTRLKPGVDESQGMQSASVKLERMP